MSHSLFASFVNTLEKLNCRQSTILVAVSGGVDSMVLAALFLETKKYWGNSPYGLAGFDFAIAHINYQLRDSASDEDAQLVRQWAQDNDVMFFEKKHNMKKLLQVEGGNLQNTARNLRYDWFSELQEAHGFDFIATAHHLQDSVETLLINFFKGSGIAGLHGIKAKENAIIRPLLHFEKSQLIDFAEAKNVPWREDASNATDTYLRNKVRRELIPIIESVFPNAKQQLFANTERFAEVENLYVQAVNTHRKKLMEQRGKDFYIPLRKLLKVQPLKTILFELVKPFGLKATQLEEILKLLNAAPGAYLNLEEYRIIRHQDFLIITAKAAECSHHILIHNEDKIVSTPHFELAIKRTNKMLRPTQISSQELLVNVGQLEFPLVLRPWKEGDYFYPFGMQRKKKKVKKILIDQKIPLHEKEKIWVLESNQKIVWLVGIRTDERFKVNIDDTNLMHFSIKPISS